MQKTAELIQNVIDHLNHVIISPAATPEMKARATDLLTHLKADLIAAKAIASSK